MVGDTATDVWRRARRRRPLDPGQLRLHRDRRPAELGARLLIDHFDELAGACVGCCRLLRPSGNAIATPFLATDA